MDGKNNQLNVFKAVAEFSSDWLMWLVDSKTIKYVSPAVETITGYEPQEFIKDANLFKQLIHPEDKENILKEFENELKKPHTCSIQFRIIHKDGSVRWIAHRCRPVFDDNNKIIGRVSNNRDITSRKLAESALKEKEKFLQSIIDGIQDPMHVIDRDYHVLLTNKKLLELKNVSQEDIRGKYCYEAYQERNEHCKQCAAKEVFKTGKPHSLIKTLPLPGGSYHYFEVYAFPLIEENGCVTQAVEITRDITTKEIAVQNMLRMTRIIEQSAEAVAITDIEGNIEYVNSAFEKITGYSLDEARGINPRILKSGEHTPEFYRELWDTITKGNIWRGQFINKNKKGKNYYEDAVIFPIKDNSGKIVNYSKIARDVTELKKAEISLREQEELLRILINSTPDIICFKDGQGRWLEANEAILKLFQLDNVGFRGKKDSELAKYNDFYYDAFMTCKDSDEITWGKSALSRGIETIPKPDGSKKVYDVIKVPLFEEDNSRKGLVVLGRDITEQKRTEKLQKAVYDIAAAADSATRLNELFPGIHKIIKSIMPAENIYFALYDEDTDIISFPYSVDEKVLSRPPRKAAKGLVEYILPTGKSHLLHPQRDNELKKSGEIELISVASAVWLGIPLAVKGKAIGVMAVQHYTDPNAYGQQERKILEYVGGQIAKTIERIRTSEALRKSEKKYRRIFEESQDVIFLSSLEGKFIDINPAGLLLFGYPSLEEIRKIDIAKDVFKNSEERQKYVERLKENGFIKDYELQLKKKDESELIVMETTTAIYDANKNIIACRGIIRDITEKKRLEAQFAQAQKMESIGTLAGGVAHDFNNLLTVINGYAEMALMCMDAGNPLHKDITTILEAGKLAENLTRQLLAFSRKQIYNPEILDINQLISSIDKILRRLIYEDISIDRVFIDNLPNIKADKSQLEQIFINLVVNARDALSAVKKPDFQKKITIETGQVFLDTDYVSKHPGSREGRHIFFIVSDNGVGMDEQTRQKVFEPFFTTKEKHKGTGLGLSMVYGIVKQNNGCVYVYSEPGKGTMFKIYWPVTDEESNAEETAVDDEILYGSETILVVEDEEEVCRFASESLTSLGYNVFKADNGRLALELIKKEKLKIDLIVTDLIMPELNGKEFIEKVKKIYQDINVIFVSGYTDNHIVHNGLLEKDVNFLHKPYSVKTLAAAVRKALDNIPK